MIDPTVIVENLTDWKSHYPKLSVISAKDYLALPIYTDNQTLRILNLCRSYRYLSVGYYCSLLAEARHQQVMPDVRTLSDLSRKSIYSVDTEDLDIPVQKILSKSDHGLIATTLELDVFFGQCSVPTLAELARQLFDLFRVPLLKVEFRRNGQWRIGTVKAMYLQTLTNEQQEAFATALTAYLNRRWKQPKPRSSYRYDLAILYNPKEEFPPSNAKALQNFIKVGKEQSINVELIEKKDYSRLAEFDALFIRETTGIDHYTYQFAKKAESEGLVVIDDPTSILRCTNKVYLEELLRTHKVRTPKTVIVRRATLADLDAKIAYPIVLKIPDGSFSRGVFKVNDRTELLEIAGRLFRSSELILAQEFIGTDYDWRVAVLNQNPIFVCQYFMSRSHWQIYNHAKGVRHRVGDFKTFLVENVASEIITTALRAANLIGDGLYGVDLKDTPQGVVVIEINDNPNIDAGVEDEQLKEMLYKIVMQDFIRRLDKKRSP